MGTPCASRVVENSLNDAGSVDSAVLVHILFLFVDVATAAESTVVGGCTTTHQRLGRDLGKDGW